MGGLSRKNGSALPIGVEIQRYTVYADRDMAKKTSRPTDAELRRFYDKSSSLQEGKRVRPVKMGFPKPRRLVALRLEEETLEAVRRLAAQKGLNYSTLMRMWITERLRDENAV